MTARDGGGPGRRMRVERGIYRQANGKYAVCFMLDGKPTFRTVGYDLDRARAERGVFLEAARWGVIAAAPRLRFDTVAGWWLGRFACKVASGGDVSARSSCIAITSIGTCCPGSVHT
jgi:hypothetical protein